MNVTSAFDEEVKSVEVNSQSYELQKNLESKKPNALCGT